MIYTTLYHSLWHAHATVIFFSSDFCWSISNDVLLSASLDGTVRLWDVAGGKCIRTVPDPMGAPVHSCAFQPLNNNVFVVSLNIAVLLYGICFDRDVYLEKERQRIVIDSRLVRDIYLEKKVKEL